MRSKSRDIRGIITTPSRSRAPVEWQLAQLAARQHGILTRKQLIDVGLGIDAIEFRATTGRLHRIHRGVYAVGYLPESPLAIAMAAVLAGGPDSVLSHRSAAALWEIGPSWRGPVELITPGKIVRSGITGHRSLGLGSREITEYRGIPVTTVARTLVDLATVLDDRALARAANEARVRHRLRTGELERLLVALRGQRGTARLRPFVDTGQPPTRSSLEDAFLAFTERYNLPRPEVNKRIAGYEVDMLWRSQRLIAELDGRRFHDSLQGFERDRDKDADLMAVGYRVIRITWRRLASDPDREARRLSALLAAGKR